MKTIQAKPINSTNVLGKKRKKPKSLHKKDEENILSRDIDVEEEMKVYERMGEKKGIKPRNEVAQSFTLKNLKFRPQKYKGNYLPYHLRWIFNNTVKSNEIVLWHEIDGLENEIERLKKLKMINRECRKISGLPFGISTNLCQCCHKVEKKKHDCTHLFCGPMCPRKKAEELMMTWVKNNAQNKINCIVNNNNNNNNTIWQSMNASTIPHGNIGANAKYENTNASIGNANAVNETNSQKSHGRLFRTVNRNLQSNSNNPGNSMLSSSNPWSSSVQFQPTKKIFGTIDRSKDKKTWFVVKNNPTPIISPANTLPPNNQSNESNN